MTFYQLYAQHITTKPNLKELTSLSQPTYFFSHRYRPKKFNHFIRPINICAQAEAKDRLSFLAVVLYCLFKIHHEKLLEDLHARTASSKTHQNRNLSSPNHPPTSTHNHCTNIRALIHLVLDNVTWGLTEFVVDPKNGYQSFQLQSLRKNCNGRK